jgi:hypothetical protein
VALHVALDAFVLREPGVAAGDNLSAGLVPLAVAALLALAYPRLGALLRGFTAIVCGALAVVAAIAIHDVVAVVGGLAGVVLLVLGIATLWRARRLDEPRARRYGRRALIGLAVLVVGLFVVAPVGLSIMATQKARSDVEPADLGTPYDDVSLTTSDGLELHGWYAPSRNGAAVMVFPGRSQPVPHARMLARHGYGVLLLDRRGEGDSEGNYNSFGWDGERDLRAALDFLAKRPDVEPGRIGGLGLSVGGEMMLHTAAYDDRLRAVVSEGAGVRSLAEQLDSGHALPWLSPTAATTAATAVLSGDSPPPSLVDLVPRIAPRRVFLIYSASGQGGEQDMNPVYHDAAGGSAELWRAPRGGHVDGLSAQPEEYERRVVGFFDGAL